jgi:hypothetical protein
MGATPSPLSEHQPLAQSPSTCRRSSSSLRDNANRVGTWAVLSHQGSLRPAQHGRPRGRTPKFLLLGFAGVDLGRSHSS